MRQSVLLPKRKLDEDIYDLTNKDHPHFDKEFNLHISKKYGTVKKFLESEIWQKYVKKFHSKHLKNGKK